MMEVGSGSNNVSDLKAPAREVIMLSSYFYPDSLTYILVKILVLGLVVCLWLAMSSTPVTWTIAVRDKLEEYDLAIE